jgi:hypothetical protein
MPSWIRVRLAARASVKISTNSWHSQLKQVGRSSLRHFGEVYVGRKGGHHCINRDRDWKGRHVHGGIRLPYGHGFLRFGWSEAMSLRRHFTGLTALIGGLVAAGWMRSFDETIPLPRVDARLLLF